MRLVLLLALLCIPAWAQNPKPCQNVTNSATSGQVLSAAHAGSSPPCTWINNGGGGGGSPTGAASGALAGTYPGPVLAAFKDAKADCGVVGNQSTDDTAAIQACIDGTADYHTINFPAGLKMKITATLNLHNRYGITLAGLTSVFSGPSAGKDSPTFYWAGADGGTMMDINRCNTCNLSGLAFFSGTGYLIGIGGANIAINSDQTGVTSGITTNGIYERLSIQGSLQNPNFIGIAFALVGGQNVEHMTVRDSNIACSYGTSPTTAVGQGITIGGSFNAKKHLYTNNSITNCATGIYIAAGSADIIHNQFNLDGTHIFATQTDPMNISDNDSENAAQFAIVNASYGMTISNNRLAALAPASGHCAVEVTGGGTALLFEANDFDAGTFDTTHTPVCHAGAGGGGLISRGNRYPAATAVAAGFATFPYVVVSENELDSVIAATAQYLNTPQTGWTNTGFLKYAYSVGAGCTLAQCPTNKWYASDNGGAWYPINPTTALGDMIYSVAGGALQKVSGNTTATKEYLSQTGTGSASAAPVWAQIAAADLSGLATVATTGSAADLVGNLSVARLNSGTSASSSTFWRGDGTWAAPTAAAPTQVNDTNGNSALLTGATASAVNQLTLTNAATAGTVSLATTGTDTNIPLTVQTKGTGTFKLITDGVEKLGALTISSTEYIEVPSSTDGIMYGNTAGDRNSAQVAIGSANWGLGLALASNAQVVFTSNSNNARSGRDTNLSRCAAGVLCAGTGTQGSVAGTFKGAILQSTVYTVATLPTCNAGAEGARAGVSDLLAPTFLTTATGGGAVHGSVYCNGTNWVTD